MADIAREELLRRVQAGESLERLDLREIQLEGALLAGANLARADLTGANLAGADLRKALLANACLREAYLQGALLGEATLRNADLDGANLSNASLEASDASRANFEGANLEGAKLNRATLQNALFSDANLGKALAVEANLRLADMTNAYLGGADLRGSDLRKATFEDANLEEADLSGADLRDCDLSSSIVQGAMLDGAKVYGLSMPRDRISQILIQWWDVSRAADGSAREEGGRIGDFLGEKAPSVVPEAPAPEAGSGARFFGEGDVLKNAELEFSSGSVVEVRGRFENCRIALGEGARLSVARSGVLRDCVIEGQGDIVIYGRMLSTTPDVFATPRAFFVGSTGVAVGTVRQPEALARFGFEPGCILRLKIQK